MKKSLSFLLAIALVFGMFSAMASAATPTASEAGAKLKELGVVIGDQNGNLMENSTWLRQDIAVILSRLLGVEPAAKATPKSHTYKDAKGTAYDGYLSWAREKGYILGHSATKFGWDEELTNQQFAAIVLRALGTDDYAHATELAIAAGILPAGAKADAPAVRGDTFVGVIAALNTEIPALGVTLGEFLKLPGFDSKAEVVSAAVTGVKKVTVTFKKAVDTSKVSFAVKKGTIGSNINAVTWNDAKTIATIETTVALTAGDYTVTASGLTFAEGKAAANFTVAAEKVDSITVDAGAYRTTAGGDDAAVGFKVLNQYGEDITAAQTATNFIVTSSKGTATAGHGDISIANKAITIIGAGAGGNTSINLTIVDVVNAKSVSKTISIEAFKAVAEVTLQAPVVPTGDTTIGVSKTDVVLPYAAKDQFGNAVTLANTTGLTFISSDSSVVDAASIAIVSEKLTFDTKAGFEGSKSVTLTVIVNATGKVSTITFTATGNKTLAEPTLVAPTSRFGANDNAFKVELQVKDQFGNALTADEINNLAVAGKLTVVSGNSGVFSVVGTAGDFVTTADGKAYVTVDAAANGTANLTVTVNSTGKSSTIALTVVDAKYAASISALVPDVTKVVYANGHSGTVTLKATFLDQYGDAITSDAGANIQFAVDNTDFGAAHADSTVAALNDTGITLTPVGHDKTTVVTVKLLKAGVAIDSRTVTIKSAKADEALTYKVDAIGTISGYDDGWLGSDFAKEVTVSAVDASGTKVALPDNALQGVSAADSAILNTDGDSVISAYWALPTTADVNTIVNVTISKVDGTPIVVQAPVKISYATPVAASIQVKKVSDDTVIAANGTITVANNDTLSGTFYVEVKDQFGTTYLSNQATVYVTTPAGVISKVTGPVTFSGSTGDKYKVTSVIADKSVTITVVIG
ncbi:hypothetical protein [Cohnella yongneupensis]|uniref:SLH domain-containing protein n=1 Tax=Cohnella yongneupensis TaxID=425006 RepID=A0ABW0R3Y7_9BACL